MINVKRPLNCNELNPNSIREKGRGEREGQGGGWRSGTKLAFQNSEGEVF